ncbi:MAG: hypothetical protein A2516_02625 [Alphaproteobacteria bacterium RIFOXYD12_FULL_60_8]|nr:MAG: hypothetical protein A2516_02625 [Alphaproteobacteria bacterium RIFOXYD12_FULL_60_8]
MIIGRLLGWLLFSLTILMASAEAVMALGTGSYDGINAGEIWTLLSGSSPEAGIGKLLQALPAWTLTGSLGLTLIVSCQPRRRFPRAKNSLLN